MSISRCFLPDAASRRGLHKPLRVAVNFRGAGPAERDGRHPVLLGLHTALRWRAWPFCDDLVCNVPDLTAHGQLVQPICPDRPFPVERTRDLSANRCGRVDIVSEIRRSQNCCLERIGVLDTPERCLQRLNNISTALDFALGRAHVNLQNERALSRPLNSSASTASWSRRCTLTLQGIRANANVAVT